MKLEKAALIASTAAAVLTTVYMGVQLYHYTKRQQQAKLLEK